MKTLLKQALSLLIAIGCPLTFAEDLHIKPGLWVVKHHGNMGADGINVSMPDATQMQQMMKNLPPEARAQMEKHIGTNGTAMASGSDVKLCISPEQAAQNDFPMHPSSNCKVINNQRNANTITLKMQCDKGDMDVTITLNNATSWNSTMKGSMKNDNKNYSMDMQATGKWLSSDCGSLKPYSPTKQPTK